MNIDIAKMFPEAARRVEILEGLKRSWAGVVGPKLAFMSQPCNLGVNELSIFVRNDKAVSLLLNSKGNILRALSRKGYKAEGDFSLRILREPMRIPSLKQTRKKNIPEIKVDEDTVNEYMKNAPETLPEDINYSLSHLKAFLDKKFPHKK